MSERAYTIREIAQALAVTRKSAHLRAKRDGWPFEEATGRGGKRRLFPLESLPAEVRVALMKRDSIDVEPKAGTAPPPSEPFTYDAQQLAEVYDRKTDRIKAEAEEKLAVFRDWERYVAAGYSQDAAFKAAAEGSRWSWRRLRDIYHGKPGREGLKLFDRKDWLYVLAGAYVGRTATAEVSPEAWDMFTAFYLTRDRRHLSECWRWVRDAAKERGWSWPPERTIRRKVDREIPREELVLLREGPEALDRLMPAQRRDRSVFHAMEAVNGDGVEFHRYCIWPTGEKARPKVWVWQDLYSGNLLAYRADVSENGDMFRLAFGDLIKDYGLVKAVYIDNTMAAACKKNTGGARNRFRFKLREDDPIGLLPSLGVDVRFTTPAHGQAKPVERAFRDLRQKIDTHPKFGNRGTKDNPLPIEEFMEVLQAEIARHNAEPGRRTPVCQGRSFREVFEESYRANADKIVRPTAEQIRRCLLAAEKVRAHSESGAVALGKGPHGENLYWSEKLMRHAGQHLVVRFDPDDLTKAVHVYTLDGRYIGEAECTWSAGFNSTDQGRAYHRARNHMRKATKEAAKAKKRMTQAAAASMMAPPPTEGGAPETNVRRGDFTPTRRKVVGVEPEPQRDEEDGADEDMRKSFDDMMLAMAKRKAEEEIW